MSVESTSHVARLKNYLNMMMQWKSWTLSKKSHFTILC